MLTVLKSRLTVLLVGAALAFGGLSLWNWYHPAKDRTMFRVVQAHYRAPESRLEGLRGIDKVTVPVPALAVLKPSQKAVEKLEKKLGGELPKGQEILSIKEIDVLPHGGRGVISLEVDSEGVGHTNLTIYPKKKPLFEFTLGRSIGVYGGVGFGHLGGQVWNVEFEQGLFRLGPAEVGAKVGLFVTPLGSDGYVMVGGRVRF